MFGMVLWLIFLAYVWDILLSIRILLCFFYLDEYYFNI